jgi:hypothetical protein
MISNWFTPSFVEQYAESGADNIHVPWFNVNNFSGLRNLDLESIRTTKDLVHIARDPRHDIVQKTYYLKVSQFNIPEFSGILEGIEVKVIMNRGGRITDDTVQLCVNNQAVGDNLANLDLGVEKIYGDGTALWNSPIDITAITESTFGIILRYQSHPHWPHKTTPLIDVVAVRVHYSPL